MTKLDAICGLLLILSGIACGAGGDETKSGSGAFSSSEGGAGASESAPPAGRYGSISEELDPAAKATFFNQLILGGDGTFHRELVGFKCEIPPCPPVENRNGRFRVGRQGDRNVFFFDDVGGVPIDSFDFSFSGSTLQLVDHASGQSNTFVLVPEPKKLAETPDRFIHYSLITTGPLGAAVPTVVNIAVDGCLDTKSNPALHATIDGAPMQLMFPGGAGITECHGPTWRFLRPLGGLETPPGKDRIIEISDDTASMHVTLNQPFVERTAKLLEPAEGRLHKGQTATIQWIPESDQIDPAAGIEVDFGRTGDAVTFSVTKDIAVDGSRIQFIVPADVASVPSGTQLAVFAKSVTPGTAHCDGASGCDSAGSGVLVTLPGQFPLD